MTATFRFEELFSTLRALFFICWGGCQGDLDGFPKSSGYTTVNPFSLVRQKQVGLNKLLT